MPENKKNLLTIAVFATSTLMLAGCGGGGSSSDTTRSTGGTLQLDSEGYGAQKAALYTAEDYDAVAASYESMNDAQVLVEDVAFSLQSFSTASTGEVRAAATETVTLGCENPEGSVVVSATFSETADRETYQFSNCQLPTYLLGPVVLNGRYEYAFDLSSATALTGYDSYNISGTVLNTGEALALVGRQDFAMTDVSATTSEVTFRTGSLEYRVGSSYVAFVNMVTSAMLSDTEISVTMDGSLVGSAMGGVVDISTPAAMVLPLAATCPTEGVFRFEGDGYVEVRYGMHTGTADVMTVETNSSSRIGYSDCTGADFAPL